MSAPPIPLPDLASFRRDQLRTAFHSAVAAGNAQPMVLPWCIIGIFILPPLYLSIPHLNRPWLHRARFLVAALVAASGVQMLRTGSSANFAVAYAVGMNACWGAVWSFAILVWMDPQREAERVERRSKPPAIVLPSGAVVSEGAIGNGHSSIRLNGGSTGSGRKPGQRRKSVRFAFPPDEDVARSLEHFEYYWQAFPAEEPFMTRLEWAFDLSTSWRGSGWNFAISAMPSFERPEKPQTSEPVKLGSIPVTSRTGLRRHTTYRSFIRHKLLTTTLSYLVLDACALLMTSDPYHVFGPNTTFPLPAHLAPLPRALTSLLRSTLGCAGILSALHLVFSLDALARVLLARRGLLPTLLGGGTRAELWHFPDIFGSPAQVLDRGLAGFWGGWWHQTFRLAFTAPATYARRRLGLDPKRPLTQALVGLCAFASSAVLHMCGSWTSLPAYVARLPGSVGGTGTRPLDIPLFFVGSWVGIVVQSAVCRLFRAQIQQVPRWGRRAGNVVFVALWLLLTQAAFLDDMSRSGIWLYEPVPVSPLRWMGLGHPGDSWWRWDRDHWPRWYVGKHWWESGLGL